MNRFESFVMRTALRVSPSSRRVLESAERTMVNQRETILYHRALAAKNEASHELAEFMAEGGQMASLAESQGRGKEGEKIIAESEVKLNETIADLELALEDRGWRRQLAQTQYEFSRWGIQRIILMSQLYFIKNPLVKRAVQISSYYVFGRGVEIQSDNEPANVVIQEFLQQPENMKELGHTGLVKKEESLHTDGNLFFVFFTDKQNGQTTVRMIPALEIQQIVCDPDDSSKPRYYQRQWNSMVFNESTGMVEPQWEECWYPDVDWYPDVRPTVIANKPVMWDTPVIHEKIGQIAGWVFGVPDVYAMLDWARAYKSFLEDWATIQKALARFSWNIKTQGGPAAISNFQAFLGTTVGNTGNLLPERNPPPVTGSGFVSGPGNELTPIKTAGTQTGPEEGRRILLMVAAAAGLPETFFGDASTGSLATAKSLDRPTELKFIEAQQRWKMLLQRILRYVLKRSKIAPGGSLREATDVPDESDKIPINVIFPSVLEHDIGEMISSIVAAASLDGLDCKTMDIKNTSRQLWKQIGMENVEEALDAIWPEPEYSKMLPKMFPVDDLDAAAQRDAAAEQAQQIQGRPPRLPTMNQERGITRAMAELRKVLTVVKEHLKIK